MPHAKHNKGILEIQFPDRFAISFKDNNLHKWTASCTDGMVYRSNQEPFSFGHPDTKYFILDGRDAEKFSQRPGEPDWDFTMRCRRDEHILMSLTNMRKAIPTKQIYLRMLQTGQNVPRPPNFRVFTDDVLEIISILAPNRNSKELSRYQNLWKSPREDVYKTISVNELIYVLNIFKINKSLIKIIPDFVGLFARNEHWENGMQRIIGISPDAKVVMNGTQSVYYIFQCLVCGLKWDMSNMGAVKEDIMILMKEFSNLEEELYIHFDKLNSKVISVLWSAEIQGYGSKNDFHLLSKGLYEIVDINEMMTSYGLPAYHEPMPVWKARYTIMKAWADQFFEEDSRIKKLVMAGLTWKIPPKERDQFLKEIEMENKRQSETKLNQESSVSKHINKIMNEWDTVVRVVALVVLVLLVYISQFGLAAGTFLFIIFFPKKSKPVEAKANRSSQTSDQDFRNLSSKIEEKLKKDLEKSNEQLQRISNELKEKEEYYKRITERSKNEMESMRKTLKLKDREIEKLEGSQKAGRDQSALVKGLEKKLNDMKKANEKLGAKKNEEIRVLEENSERSKNEVESMKKTLKSKDREIEKLEGTQKAGRDQSALVKGLEKKLNDMKKANEKLVAKKNEEIRVLEDRIATQSKCVEENKKLKSRISELEKSQTELKKTVKSIKSTPNIPVNECYICLDKRDDTEDSLECEKCGVKVHKECGLKWIKEKPICGWCKKPCPF